MKSKTAICFLLLASTCLAQAVVSKDTTKSKDADPQLRSELSVFEPFLGTWVFEGKLPDGLPRGLRKQCTIGMEGNFVILKTTAGSDSGKEYQTDLTIWRWDREKNKVVLIALRLMVHTTN